MVDPLRVAYGDGWKDGQGASESRIAELERAIQRAFNHAEAWNVKAMQDHLWDALKASRHTGETAARPLADGSPSNDSTTNPIAPGVPQPYPSTDKRPVTGLDALRTVFTTQLRINGVTFASRLPIQEWQAQRFRDRLAGDLIEATRQATRGLEDSLCVIAEANEGPMSEIAKSALAGVRG